TEEALLRGRRSLRRVGIQVYHVGHERLHGALQGGGKHTVGRWGTWLAQCVWWCDLVEHAAGGGAARQFSPRRRGSRAAEQGIDLGLCCLQHVFGLLEEAACDEPTPRGQQSAAHQATRPAYAEPHGRFL